MEWLYMNCREAIPLVHEYLDGELHGAQLIDLNKHLLSCDACKLHLTQLQKTEAFLFTWPKPSVSETLTDRIMNALPQENKRSKWLQWMRKHPALSAAVLFVLFMFASFITLWQDDTALVVKGKHLDQVVIQGDTVIVPEGQTVNGDLVVENGKIQVDGEVNGNLVVIDGSLNLASTAHIAGKVTRIDQALDWLWYKVGEMFSVLTN
jgi:anti-sigma factor RsiW